MRVFGISPAPKQSISISNLFRNYGELSTTEANLLYALQKIRDQQDHFYCNALRFLYRDGELSDEGLENGLTHVEDWMAEKTMKEIAADMEEKNSKQAHFCGN